jgi:type I restriction enzyme M protein
MKREMDLELEKKLWDAADQMRGNISSEEYMHIVIGVMFLKHMSDKYNIAVEKIKNDFPNKWEYVSLQKDILANDYDVSFVIPEIGNWEYIKKFASKKEIGQILDSAFIEIEKANPSLKGLFNKNYNREEIDQSKLGNVISIFSNIDLAEFGEDIIGRTYEYFLGNFFKTQGSKGGEFYTPKSVVKMMVEILNPHDGLLYDPACGTGGMFVQAREHLIKTGKNPDSLIIYGQEYQNKTWQLANINLLIHGFNENNINLGSKSADSFGEDLWLDKMNTFDYVLANPPFNMKKWGSEKLDDDPRWQWGRPSGTANYAWLSLMISKLNKDGKAAIVLSNGSLSANDNSSLEIRKNFIESNLVEAIIALPLNPAAETGRREMWC